MSIEKFKDGKYFFKCGGPGHKLMVSRTCDTYKEADDLEIKHYAKYHDDRTITNLPSL
jgi:hypothetical protein